MIIILLSSHECAMLAVLLLLRNNEFLKFIGISAKDEKLVAMDTAE